MVDTPLTRERRELWCLHVLGMDDVHPAPDRATAQLWAAQWTVLNQTRRSEPHPFDPVISWIVAEWPWSAVSHAAGLEQSIRDNTFPVDPLAALSVPAADGWRDIGSAPKDGSEVILKLSETIPDHYEVRAGSFINGDEASNIGNPEYPHGAWMIWHERGDDWYLIDATEPRGWMPLPAAPKDTTHDQ